MMMQNMELNDVAKLIRDGIASNLEDLIYAELKAQAETTVRKVAKEIAERVSANITSYQRADDLQTRVDLNFNLVDESATPIGTIVSVYNGVPTVSWSLDSNLQQLVGKSIFSA